MYILIYKKNNNIMNDFKDFSDLINKTIVIHNKTINIYTIETITNSTKINDFILRKTNNLHNTTDIYEYLFNNLPCVSIKKINRKEITNYLVNGFTIIEIDNKYLAIETIDTPNRSVTNSDYEKSITGPKDSFTENFNTNVGLIRKRIKTSNLKLENITIGKYTNTKVGIMYINTICKKDLKDKIIKKIKNINIDGIVDSSYLISYLSTSHNLFPTIKRCERPDLVTESLLEGKIIIITDNSPDVLILPTFFIDFFHMSDDYYQKNFNTSFIRLIRLLAFIISIILPSYYVAITTWNVNLIPINLLVNLVGQRSSVPFPAFLEAFIMIISFEILRESDIRIPSTQGTAISILGGLVLGDAAVSAGIISPIIIIVVAISAISGMVFQSIEMVNAIRFWRFILIILASILGLYGIFIGIVLIIINITDTKSIDEDYLYPLAPINFNEQKDGFIKIKEKIKKRNPVISDNSIRGYE